MNEECEERQRNSECNTEESTVLKALLPWMENIASLIKTGFEKHLDCLQAEIYSMKKELDEEKKKRKALEESKKGLEFQVILLNKRVCEVEEEMDKIEQRGRLDDIVIDNMERKEVSDPKKHLQEIINKVLMAKTIEDDDMINATIIPNKRDPTKMTMIGKLKGEYLKKAILTQKKMFTARNMFPKENLTPYRQRIFMAARKFCKENGFRFVWTKNGNVFVRKDENAPKTLVTNQTILL